MTDDSTSYHSADDETATSGTNSTPVAADVSHTEEQVARENDEEINMNILKSKMKHLFVLSENGKPVFSR